MIHVCVTAHLPIGVMLSGPTNKRARPPGRKNQTVVFNQLGFGFPRLGFSGHLGHFGLGDLKKERKKSLTERASKGHRVLRGYAAL